MAFYAEEGDVWKCPKHPSRRRHVCGVCPTCLRDRLSDLCPDCAHPIPCACSSTSATSSSPASSSSSFSRFSSDTHPCSGGGPTVSTLISGEPAFRRSRSVATIPFLLSRFAGDKAPPLENKSKSSIWSVFKTQKSKREKTDDNYDQKMIMTRSRSVAVEGYATSSPAKGRGWYFPSPMKVFRQSKSSYKVIHEKSPLYRG